MLAVSLAAAANCLLPLPFCLRRRPVTGAGLQVRLVKLFAGHYFPACQFSWFMLEILTPIHLSGLVGLAGLASLAGLCLVFIMSGLFVAISAGDTSGVALGSLR